ncbi:MAG: MotA/TolQ/ExbB proton channel family protein [Deltaproteobacteria bacterium]|nr:MotA/TolQ/ExbB proton channel family protein [Deltaproteobacteria bacterium]
MPGSSGKKKKRGVFGLVAGLFGGRPIDQLVEDNFPTWEEFSQKKMETVGGFELPPHKVNLTSPLQRNVVYILIAGFVVALGYHEPDWATVLLYGSILAAFSIALLHILRDSLFFHLEGTRLEADGDLINQNRFGPDPKALVPKERGLLGRLFGRARKKTVFRSKLLQIHYQNILRTYEQGNRRAWVNQDASLLEIQTLLTQRGMKLSWTVIEVLPQLGLVGTLVGLATMFQAFGRNVAMPEVSILAGFATALGTTILANLFVLVLRPLHMQNERSVMEVLSTLQTLMAMFILPTQQMSMRSGYAAAGATGVAMPASVGETRLARAVEELSRMAGEITQAKANLDSDQMIRETTKVAQEVQFTLKAFQEALNPQAMQQQQALLEKIEQTVRGLTLAVGGLGASKGAQPPIEMDMLQLRVLTHDILVLLEQMHHRLPPPPKGDPHLLSSNQGVRHQVFHEDDPSKGK